MCNIKKFLKICLIVLTIFSFSMPISAKAEEGFDIDHYDVQMIVEEDGTYHVTETLDVHFTEMLHGIYLQIPSAYFDVTWEVDGETITKDYSFPVTNINALSGQETDISTGNYGVTVRLGDADRYANEYETYKISYDIHASDLELGGIQSFYQNIISNRWATVINGVTFSVQFPKEFDAGQVYFYTEGNTVDDALTYSIEGNTIIGSYNAQLSEGKGITIKVDLPEDYFIFPTMDNLVLPLAIFSGIILVAVLLLYLKYGKDDKVIKTVEFTAPKGMSSAGVGYVIDGNVDNKDVTSLIFDWANKGYLTIADEKDDLRFKKCSDLPKEAHHYETILFNGIFDKKDETTSKELSSTIYSSFENSKKAVNDFFDLKKNRIYVKNSFAYQIIAAIFAALPIALMGGVSIYYITFISMSSVLAVVVIEILLLVGILLLIVTCNRWQGFTMGAVATLVCGVLIDVTVFIVVYFIVSMTSNNVTFIYLMMVLIASATILLSCFMVKRTPLGVRQYGQVLGLKDFIIHAEKDRLEMLVRDDPQYFYHILPYAYALGISDIWNEHFKTFDLEPPNWYYGNNVFHSYMFMSMLNRNMMTMQHPIPPVQPVSGRTGGGFGGGGFGGGGGFSGGGFGGTSGGGW